MNGHERICFAASITKDVPWAVKKKQAMSRRQCVFILLGRSGDTSHSWPWLSEFFSTTPSNPRLRLDLMIFLLPSINHQCQVKPTESTVAKWWIIDTGLYGNMMKINDLFLHPHQNTFTRILAPLSSIRAQYHSAPGMSKHTYDSLTQRHDNNLFNRRSLVRVF